MGISDQPDFQKALETAKLRALAEFAAGAGHEINNPVATIIGYAQQLLAGETDPDRRHALTTIGGQAYRIRDMIGDVMLFARPPQARPETIDAAAVCSEVIGKFSADAMAAGIELVLEASHAVPVFADPVQLCVALSAMIRNSLEYTDRNGRIRVGVTVAEESGRTWAVIEIRDNGRGLSELDREHLFDPFYSGRQAGRGLGFGLSKAWRIVTLHGGEIEVESPPDGGAVFQVRLPVGQSTSP